MHKKGTKFVKNRPIIPPKKVSESTFSHAKSMNIRHILAVFSPQKKKPGESKRVLLAVLCREINVAKRKFFAGCRGPGKLRGYGVTRDNNNVPR